jgi:spore maturation protein CgeB
MNLCVIGLSVTSSWGNGHATTYRALLRDFARRGHSVTFLERDAEWYRNNRDLPNPDFCRAILYSDFDALRALESHVREADAVIVGSYVPEGVRVGEWALGLNRATAFYDIDTPVTLAKLERGDFEYISPELISRYAAYFSFSGGPTLQVLEEKFGSPRARALYCSVDSEAYFPEATAAEYDLSYLGTYSDDRQPTLDALLLEPARRWEAGRFCVAGPQYPAHISWAGNVRRIEHLPPAQHRAFYNASRWTLNVTRADMIRAGWSPSVRLFEAAACATPIISDPWDGLGDFFPLGSALRVARNSEEALEIVRDVSEDERREIGLAGRAQVLAAHTSAHRAKQLEAMLLEMMGG